MHPHLGPRMAKLFSLAMFFLCLAPALGFAANFGVSPVRVELSPTQRTAALTLRNAGDEAVVVQLQLVAWSQEGGQDIYIPTTDLIATPPIFTIKAGGAQVVRVGLRRAPDPLRELSYRIYLQEVPGPPKLSGPGLQMALRIGLPVFVAPEVPRQRDVQWRGEQTAQGGLKIRALNNGNAHVQIIDFKLTEPGKELVAAASQGAGYLLPGQAKEWLLKLDAPLTTDRLRLKAITVGGEINAELPIAKP